MNNAWVQAFFAGQLPYCCMEAVSRVILVGYHHMVTSHHEETFLSSECFPAETPTNPFKIYGDLPFTRLTFHSAFQCMLLHWKSFCPFNKHHNLMQPGHATGACSRAVKPRQRPQLQAQHAVAARSVILKAGAMASRAAWRY